MTYTSKDTTVDLTMLPTDFLKMTPKDQRAVRDRVRKMLALTQKGRDVAMIGVTETIPFKDGTPEGSLHPDRPYYIPWDEFTTLRLCPQRSNKVLLLDHAENPVRNATSAAIRMMLKGKL